MPLSYDLTAFQILWQNLSNFFVDILVQTMTPKGHFEIKVATAKNDKKETSQKFL